MLRIQQGSAYWIGAEARFELAEGDAFLVASPSQGLVRASQLGEVSLAFFTVNPDLLAGFLTLPERHLLNAPGATSQKSPLHFPASHVLARQLGQFGDDAGPGQVPGLLRRCQLLQMFASALQSRLGQLPAACHGGQCNKRFRELVDTLSEPELMRFTPGELAARCGCSVRHFARLFHAQFGCSVRDKLTELRLRKARELLLLDQATVAGVARATGFRHLRLFNAVFKRHFGATPRAWRDQHRPSAGAG
jgi:AraC-like DNA-binding protein